MNHFKLRPKRLAAIVGQYLLIRGALAASGGVIVDGATGTNVSTAVNGRQTIDIAQTVSGVSHNTYSQFNVGKAGVDFNNVGVNARNIVNQVTSTNPSLIEGPVTVLGPRANVIIANPNGITVNGGSFVNTGNVALTTGQVGFHDFAPAPGQTQRNAILNTNKGQIEIGPDGLSGTMLKLELIAKNVKINGPVVNLFSHPNAGVRVVAGDSNAEFDGSVSPTDNLTPWARHANPNTSNPGATVLDITPLGSLTGGRIELVITDHGAAVKHAGAVFANVGDFVVSANGDLQVAGGRIRAAKDLIVATTGLTTDGGQYGNAQFEAARNIDIRSTRITVANTRFDAGSSTVDADGTTSIVQRGDILLGVDGQATSAATAISGGSFNATGGIGNLNLNHAINIDASALTANQNILLSGQRASLAARWIGNASQAMSLTSQTGIVSLDMAADVVVSGAKIDGAGGALIRGGDLRMSASRSADGSATEKAQLRSSGAAIDIQTSGAAAVIGSDILAATDVTVKSAGFSIVNDGATGSVMVAVNGGVVIKSSAELTNAGSLIQGNSRIAGNPASQGAVTLIAAGNILNESPSEKQLGAIFGKNDDVVIQAAGNIVNRHARMLTNAALRIEALGDVENIVDKQAGINGETAQTYQSDGARWLMLNKRTSGFDVDYGRVAMPRQLAYMVAGTTASITGRDVINRGGEILANNGNINVVAARDFRNEALFDGQAHFKRECLIFCSASASSTVQSHGGLMSASKDIAITAGSAAVNLGGRVLALDNLSVTAPNVYARGVVGYSAYQRDRGFKAWFGDTWARLYAMDVGGTWTANSGKLTIHGQGVIDGGSFAGSAGVDASDAIITKRPASRDPVTIENHLGLSAWLWR
jgi:filamentous hemagglutinin family protein